nr:hypothetical protein ISGA_09215 [Gordonia sp. NB41Y]
MDDPTGHPRTLGDVGHPQPHHTPLGKLLQSRPKDLFLANSLHIGPRHTLLLVSFVDVMNS